MTEDKKAFTVTDRRHFTAEGEVREAAPPPADPGPAPSRTPRLDFAALVVSLAAQASLLLGDPGESGPESPPPDLKSAQEVIDLLEDLQRRTEGRVSADEGRLMEELLYDLRLRYVSRMGRG
jgi:hypothetical protein